MRFAGVRMGHAQINPRWSAVCLSVALAFTSGVSAATIEEVEKAVIQAQGRVQSYSAQTETRQDLDLGEGNRTKVESKGPMEWLQRDGKVLYRLVLKGTTVTTVSGAESKMKSEALMVCDGDFMYILNDIDGQKSAMKAKVDPTQVGDAKGMFAAWRKDWEAVVLPDEKHDGQDCYVVQLTPRKKEEGSLLARQKCWLRKDIGQLTKMVVFGQHDKPTMTTTMTDIKTGVEFKPEHFKFKLPEGVQMMDMTRLQTDTAPASTQESDNGKSSADSLGTGGRPQADDEARQPAEPRKPAENQDEKKEEKAAKSVLKNLFK